MPEAIDFSVIIPTCNRPRQLEECLTALAGLDYPSSKFEVIVVDDGGEYPAEPVAGAFRERLNLVVHRQAPAGPAVARNMGAGTARGQYLVFTDDDCVVSPEWLKQFALRVHGAPHGIIGGATVNALPDNVYSTASQALINYLCDYYTRSPGEARFLVSGNLLVPADVFRSLGGYDATYPLAAAEDRDFCDRARLRNWAMVYAREVVVGHRHALGAFSYCKQHVWYGRGAFRFRRLHSSGSKERVRIEPLHFYSGMLVYPFHQPEIRRPLAVASLLVVSQIANAAGFFYEWGLHLAFRGKGAQL